MKRNILGPLAFTFLSLIFIVWTSFQIAGPVFAQSSSSVTTATNGGKVAPTNFFPTTLTNDDGTIAFHYEGNGRIRLRSTATGGFTLTTNGVSVGSITNLDIILGTNMSMRVTNFSGNVVLSLSATNGGGTVSGGSISIGTNNVNVVSSMTNLNVVAGANISVAAVNASGDVTLTISGAAFPGGVNNNLLFTNQPYANNTNFVLAYTNLTDYHVIEATNDIFFTHSTNRAAGQWRHIVVTILSGTSNRWVGWNTGWTVLGAFTNKLLIASNSVMIFSIGQRDALETNCVVAYQTAVPPIIPAYIGAYFGVGYNTAISNAVLLVDLMTFTNLARFIIDNLTTNIGIDAQSLSATNNRVRITFGTNGITGNPMLGIGHWNETNDIMRIQLNNADRFRFDSNGVPRIIMGASTSWAAVGGLVSVNTTVVANAGTSETNLITYSVPAHSLTNSGDRIKFRATGTFVANADNKQLKVIFGSETLLDTGTAAINSGGWTIVGEIIRTGNTNQFCSAEYHGAGAGTFTTTGNASGTWQTNGIATTLKITGTAAGSGDITNRTFAVEYWPSP